MLSNAEKVDVRRFAGYGSYGSAGPTLATNGPLEYKIDHLLAEEENILRTVYLARLVTLETDAIDQTAQNLDTDEAAVWIHNKNELYERRALYFDFRCQMCDFLGIAPGLGLQRSVDGKVAQGGSNSSNSSNGINGVGNTQSLGGFKSRSIVV